MLRLLALLVIVLLSSCENKNSVSTRFFEDGSIKPSVALAPVVDSTSYDLPWSLSDEFSTLLRNQLIQKQDLYVVPKEHTEELNSSSDTPFGSDISWVKERYAANEFVVFAELIQHNTNPAKKDPTSTNLNMAIRVRVIDNRGETPKIILQECLNENYYIARNSAQMDYNSTTWGTKEYENSRMGVAHFTLAEDLVERIYDYVLLKSR
ncbi:MAG: hypothetical protein HZB76_05555 [Chlamydiae bacterium]|nr:hypothetical protein [Chlamydiota bacterium]